MDVIIFGTGGHAKVVLDTLNATGRYTPIAFVSLADLKSFQGLPHFHQNHFLDAKCSKGIVAIGDNWLRNQVTHFIQKQAPGFEFINAIHPTAVIAENVKIKAGTVVMANATINTGTQIGQHCIVNTSASVDHDCILGDYSSLAPAVVLGGSVQIGESSAISIAACAIHGVKVGNHTVIGAQSLVLKDVGDLSVAYGSPCRFIRNRIVGEKYL